MDLTIDQQVALDEALVPHVSRLRIRKSNFCLRSDIKSKESTLQVVYDVLKLTPFYKAFLVTADVPEIYIEMLQICLRIPNQPFDELPFEEETLAFLIELGHSGEIQKITYVKHKDAKKSNEMYYLRFTKNTQQYGAILPVELTNEAIKNSKSFKEYYAIDSGAEPPMTKASVRKT
nr:hypothetical protein [Tanacetum cinerariifolium]GFA15500.1 hypothetical protein [Tanacetum cinerariifolium]